MHAAGLVGGKGKHFDVLDRVDYMSHPIFCRVGAVATADAFSVKMARRQNTTASCYRYCGDFPACENSVFAFCSSFWGAAHLAGRGRMLRPRW